jgi:uncharacterized protein
MSKTYVLYHANCNDGFGAAWAARNALGDDPEIVEYHAMVHGDPLPEMQPKSCVYFLDFCWDREGLAKLQMEMRIVTVLDHHKSAFENVGDMKCCTFDMNRSGAMMSWDFFNSKSATKPMLLNYIQDCDLWQWKYPFSKEVTSCLSSYPRTWETWDWLMHRPIDLMIEEGKHIRRMGALSVERVVENTGWASVQGYVVPCVNSTVSQSEIGNELCKKYPQAAFACVYRVGIDGSVYCSLRSIGDFDVSAVAGKYEIGGGHKNASGFTTDKLPKFVSKPV